MPKRWPDDIQHFLDSPQWTFAATYAKNWPHHYLVKDRVDGEFFTRTVLHIRQFGQPEHFYRNTYLYYKQDGIAYWTMVPPKNNPAWYLPEDETIINKCPIENTYEYRLKNNTLPQ